MEILRVVDSLVCTRRVEGLAQVSLRILQDRKGKQVVATDPVGVRPGNWVFTTSGSAARYAMGDPKILTDLTIGGIIDHWGGEESKPAAGETPAATTPVSGPAAAHG
jgi:carboxysome peptide B